MFRATLDYVQRKQCQHVVDLYRGVAAPNIQAMTKTYVMFTDEGYRLYYVGV